MRTEVKLEADRLAEALRERVENLQGGGAPQAMAKACQIVLRTAKRYAPKDTGLLRRSLTYRVVREARTSWARWDERPLRDPRRVRAPHAGEQERHRADQIRAGELLPAPRPAGEPEQGARCNHRGARKT